MSEKQDSIRKVINDISELNNKLHGVLNDIVLIRTKLNKHGLSFDDIKFDEKRIIAIEKAMELYSK